jgi:hypothetical protein
MSRSPGPRLLAEVGSGAIMYSMTPDLAPLPRWALVLPRVSRPRTSPPYRGELKRCHVSLSSKPCFPIEVGSSASMCLLRALPPVEQTAPTTRSMKGSGATIKVLYLGY